MWGDERAGGARIARRGANKEGGMANRRGFTLLELLMVVIIIGILAAIALPQYVSMSERSRATEALINLDAIRGSELRYKAENTSGNYTTNLTQLDVTVQAPGQYWNFSVMGTTTGSNARATRSSTNATIDIDLDSGNTCTSDANMYHLAPGTC